MAVDAGAPRHAATFPPIPIHRRLYGLGSIYGKTMRDSRLAFLIMTGLVAGFMLAIGQAFGTAYGTPEMRQEVANLVATVPPVMAGMAGNPVEVDTMGGFITYKYGPFFALLAGLWSILALSGTLAGEARRGSLDFVAAAPFGKRRVALEKLAAHVSVMALSMACLALITWLAGSVFGDAALGDEISALSAIGFALWVGLLALVSGAVAFALAPVVGRASAAGTAGVVMLLSFVVGNYAPYVPEFESIAGVSWYHWTYDHVPLAAQYDWASLGLVAIVTVILMAVGVELFSRRDLGIMTGLPVPGLPRASLGLRGPIGRAFGDQLPLALGWGIGIGVFGFVLAAVSRSFGDDLVTRFPTFADIIRAVFPGVDMASAGWFLQLVFVEVGLIVVGFSAATFIGTWASDEESGRLETLLTAPLTRRGWAVSGGIGALLAVALSTLVYALGIGIGGAFGGSEVLTPMVGTVALGFYAAAMVGLGVAIGGLWRTTWAAELVAAVVILTFLVNLLAPALQLPDWVQQLALTAHLGQPMIGTWDPLGMAACAVIAIGGILLGAWGMDRRDVAG
jgi:ABC-2 type transport system permease protein